MDAKATNLDSFLPNLYHETTNLHPELKVHVIEGLIYCSISNRKVMKSIHRSSSILQQLLLPAFFIFLTSDVNLKAADTLLNSLSYKNFPASSTAKSPKKFILATGEWTMAQIIPWTFDRYVMQADYARINGNTIKRNLKFSSWQMDDNLFYTNFLAHPLHGSLYFNSFRSNGYNFWQSSAAVLAGTYVWETFMETEYPSPNDLINTTLGGMILGEMTNRLSQLIIGHKKIKTRKYIQDPLALMINPMGGLTRIVTNQYGKPISDQGLSPASFIVDAGYRQTGYQSMKGTSHEFFTSLQVIYGNPWLRTKKPFNSFSLLAEFGSSDSGILNVLKVEGPLFNKVFKNTHTNKSLLNITMNYECIKYPLFRYAGQGIRSNYHIQLAPARQIICQFKAGAGIIFIAAMPNCNLHNADERNYDYCSGLNANLGASINIANRIYFEHNTTAGKYFSIHDSGNWHLLRISQSALRMQLFKNFSISAKAGKYHFNSVFEEAAREKRSYSVYNISAGYSFNL